MYDTGLRVGEIVALNVEHLRDDNTTLYVSSAIQKDHATDESPGSARLGLADDTTRTLSAFLASRWKDTEALFSSRSSPQLTLQAVRNMIERVAVEPGVGPFLADGSRGRARRRVAPTRWGTASRAG